MRAFERGGLLISQTVLGSLEPVGLRRVANSELPANEDPAVGGMVFL
jgi:hypothetical protein